MLAQMSGWKNSMTQEFNPKWISLNLLQLINAFLLKILQREVNAWITWLPKCKRRPKTLKQKDNKNILILLIQWKGAKKSIKMIKLKCWLVYKMSKKCWRWKKPTMSWTRSCTKDQTQPPLIRNNKLRYLNHQRLRLQPRSMFDILIGT